MVTESANFASTVNASKSEQEPSVNITKEENVNDQGIPEAGTTSSVGPAVVNNISATTLETSRAVNAPEQSAAQNRLNDIVEAEKKGQNQPTNEELTATGNLSQQRSRLDETA